MKKTALFLPQFLFAAFPGPNIRAAPAAATGAAAGLAERP